MVEPKHLREWEKDLLAVSLPLWDELPDIDIYMDQLVTLVERYTHSLIIDEQQVKGITSSMINNYVKLKLIPKPIKKKYNKQHLARLIVITILKQAFDIPSVKAGVEYQITLTNSKEAYNFFCHRLESTIDFFTTEQQEIVSIEEIKDGFKPIQMACTTLVAKLITEKELADLLSYDLHLGDK